MQLFNVGKYKSIVFSTGIFIFLIAGVMGLNFVISSQIAKDAVGINLAGRQRTLSQQIITNLFDLQDVAQQGGDVARTLRELNNNAALFDKTLNAFLKGGETIGSDRKPVTIKQVTSSTGHRMLEEALSIWPAYNNLIGEITAGNPQKQWFQNVALTTEYAQLKSDELLRLTRDLTAVIRQNADPLTASLASRQSMLSQRLALQLSDLLAMARAGQPIQARLENMDQTFRQFDTTLNAFIHGGQTTDDNDNVITIAQVNHPQGQTILASSVELWNAYKVLLQDVISGSPDSAWFRLLSEAANYGREHNLTLLTLMNGLTTDLQQLTTAKVTRLRYIQIGAATLAIVFFFLILFGFVRQLGLSDQIAEKAQRENEDILRTVKEGLFLLDKDLKIGSQYSAATKDVFNKEELADQSFKELLGKMITEKDMKLSEDFIDLLFGERVNEKLIVDINPLNQVEVNVEKEGMVFETKYLSFNFKRTIENNQVNNILVTVSDISEKIKLQQELERLKESTNVQFDMLMHIMHVDQNALMEFLHGTIQELNDINEIFKKTKLNNHNYRQDIDPIFRIMHRLKGEAGALGLESFETRAHEFEDLLTGLREQSALSGNDFLPLAIKLDDLMDHQSAVQSMVNRLVAMKDQNPSATATVEAEYTIADTLNSMAQRIAQEQGKKVILRKDRMDVDIIPEHYQKPVRSIAIQLIRNAISHGIETPEERVAAQKDELGLLQIAFAPHDDGYILSLRDNGRGIDHERLRAKAVESGRWSADEVQAWSQDRLMDLLYVPGFSTASETTHDAGRGMGMDIIKDIVDDLGGRIEMTTQLGQSCEFRVVLP